MKLWLFLAITALVAAVWFSGCGGTFSAKATPTPVPTPSPTPLPTPARSFTQLRQHVICHRYQYLCCQKDHCRPASQGYRRDSGWLTAVRRQYHRQHYVGVSASSDSVIKTFQFSSTVSGGAIGVTITPVGSKAYVLNSNDNMVTVIGTSSLNVTGVIVVGKWPEDIGMPTPVPRPTATPTVTSTPVVTPTITPVPSYGDSDGDTIPDVVEENGLSYMAMLGTDSMEAGNVAMVLGLLSGISVGLAQWPDLLLDFYRDPVPMLQGFLEIAVLMSSPGGKLVTGATTVKFKRLYLINALSVVSMKLWQLVSIAAIVAAVLLSGCISATPGVTPTATPVPATATPEPSPTEAPPEIGMEHGTQVRLSNATVSLANTTNPELQAENFTLTFENIGDAPAYNVGFRFTAKDLRKGWELFSQGYTVGTIPGNSQVSYNLTTPEHKEAYSVTADIEIIWGENLEYNNTYQKSFTLVGLP